MAKESKIQSDIIKDLKKMGCVALKYPQNATTHAGVADVFFCYEGFYGWIEVKQTKSSPRRPGQKEFIDKMENWSFGRIVWGGKNSNWPEVKREIEAML